MSSTSAAQYQVHGFEAVVASDSMRKLMQMVERVARANASVLITGETGCGKEFIARALHHNSLRCNKPWIDLNCAALPEHLVESELFGYEKGAFSGADSMKPGLFELANGGTLFLDEIGELEPKIQVKLLRVLDNVPYYRLGGNKKVSVDVRVIAATNQDLTTAVKTGRFRSDLYHRLGQIQLRIPSLRERPDDVEALADYFLQQNSPGSKFSSEALNVLRTYKWYGNVRELRNLVIQVSMTAESDTITAKDLPPEILTELEPAPLSATVAPALIETVRERRQPNPLPPPEEPEVTDLDSIEKQTILRALGQTGGHQGQAAEQLGISRRTLSRKLKQYHLQAGRNGEPLGLLSREQQQYFRATVEVPITLVTERGAEVQAITMNISSGGMCMSGIDNPLQCAGLLTVRFPFPPDTDHIVEVKGEIVWADTQKKAGLKFVDFPVEMQGKLNRWLHAKQLEEGWTANAQSEEVPLRSL